MVGSIAWKLLQPRFMMRFSHQFDRWRVIEFSEYVFQDAIDLAGSLKIVSISSCRIVALLFYFLYP